MQQPQFRDRLNTLPGMVCVAHARLVALHPLSAAAQCNPNPTPAVAKAEDGVHALVAMAWAATRDALNGSRSAGPPAAGGAAAGGAGTLSVVPHGALDATPAGAAGAAAAAPAAALVAAAHGGALCTLAGLLGGAAFQTDGDEGHRAVCAHVAYRLLTEALDFDVAHRRCVPAYDTTGRCMHVA